MKVKVNDEDIFELAEFQKQVICNDIPYDVFEADMKRRLEYIIMHKYEQCFKRLKEEWDIKLQDRVDSLPTKPEAYVKLVMSQSDYKCRKTRDDLDKVAASEA